MYSLKLASLQLWWTCVAPSWKKCWMRACVLCEVMSNIYLLPARYLHVSVSRVGLNKLSVTSPPHPTPDLSSGLCATRQHGHRTPHAPVRLQHPLIDRFVLVGAQLVDLSGSLRCIVIDWIYANLLACNSILYVLTRLLSSNTFL